MRNLWVDGMFFTTMEVCAFVKAYWMVYLNSCISRYVLKHKDFEVYLMHAEVFRGKVY